VSHGGLDVAAAGRLRTSAPGPDPVQASRSRSLNDLQRQIAGGIGGRLSLVPECQGRASPGQRPRHLRFFHLHQAPVAYQMQRMLNCLDLGTIASEDLCGEGGHSSGRLPEAS
jgi:hypothetical protein